MITRVRRDRQAELERIARLKHDGPLSKTPNAYFGSLQVSQNAHVPSVVSGLSADVLSNLRVIGLCPMTKIEAKDIDARSQQATNHVLTLARGPHRCNNLGAA